MAIFLTILILLMFLLALYFFISPVYTSLTDRVPFVPSPRRGLGIISDFMEITDNSIVYDLGCGDGRILTALAKRNKKARYVGVENDWFPYVLAKIRSLPYKNVTIVWQDFFKTDVTEATHVFVYLYPRLMDELAPKFDSQLGPGSTVVSYMFKFKDREPSAVTFLRKKYKKLYRYNFK